MHLLRNGEALLQKTANFSLVRRKKFGRIDSWSRFSQPTGARRKCAMAQSWEQTKFYFIIRIAHNYQCKEHIVAPSFEVVQSTLPGMSNWRHDCMQNAARSDF